MGGTASTISTSSCRDAGVANWETIALLTPMSVTPSSTPTRRIARRESRIVLPKTLPNP